MDSARRSDTQGSRLHDLFIEALDLAPAERAVFVARACGDDAQLRARLEELLGAAQQHDDAFLQTPVLSAAAGAALAAAQDGLGAAAGTPLEDPERIGPYRIVERLGEGGMGVVYRAEQQEPVRRQVALKVVKPGMDSARVIARFEAERQALALMDHPGIARIYDGGATAEGRPFFVMELVAGEPIHDYCNRQRMRTRDRLALFAAVCDAVQHAHQKGVIHRDLKPSNVLVVERDGKPHPAVIDFGIARAMTESQADDTRVTRLHEQVGTLEYMAPEQAGGQAGRPGADIDSRADIYSLGVMLFELLTGELPFDAITPVDQRTPHAPSTRVGRNHTTTAAAISQATDPRALRRMLRGELDWITIKALERDRERRYASASELAADVRRYLANEPVLAGPPGAWYRLRTFARRHRVPVAAAALAAIAVLAGGTAAAWGWLEARTQRDTAQALAGRLDAEAQHLAAEVASSERAADLVVDWLAMINLENGPFDKRKLLDRAAREVGAAFGSRPRAEANVRKVLGEAYASIGENDLAVQQFARALALLDGLPDAEQAKPEVLEEVLWLYWWSAELAGYPNLPSCLSRRAQQTAIDAFYGDHVELARGLSALIREPDCGRYAAHVDRLMQYAEQHLSDDDPRWRLLADCLGTFGAVAWLRLAAAGPEDPTSAWFPPATRIYREKVKLPPSNSRLLRTQVCYINQLGMAGRHAEALALARTAAAQLDTVLPQDHNYQAWLRFTEGQSHCGLGDFERGLPQLEESLAILGRIHDRSYATPFVLRHAIGLCAAAGRGERARELRERLVAELLRTPNGALELDEVEAALGPEQQGFVTRLKACQDRCEEANGYVPELADVVAECRHRFGEHGDQAAIVAGRLIGLAQRFWRVSPSAEGFVEVLEYGIAACRDSRRSLLPHALWLLSNVQLRIGAPEAALATAPGVREQSDGWPPRLHDGVSCMLVGAALARLGRDGDEQQLVAGYEKICDALGVVEGNTVGAHAFLQEFYLARGRAREGVDFAYRRLRLLLRQSGLPHAVSTTLWAIVRTEAGAGPPAQLALEAARKLCMLDPERGQYHLGLGAALLRTGAPAEALRELAEAERLGPAQTLDGPNTPVALPALRAIALSRSGRPVEARAALARARAELADVGRGRLEADALLAEAEAALQGR